MSTLLTGLTVAAAVLVVGSRFGGTAPRGAPRNASTPPSPDHWRVDAVDPVDVATNRIRLHLVRGIIAVALTWLLGPLLVIGTVFAVFASGRLRRILSQRRVQRHIDRDLPEALDLFVLLLEAGVSTRSVVVEMARRGPTSTRPAFAHVADRLDIGEPFAEAMVQLRTRLGEGAVALVDLVTASHRYGLPMAQVVHQLSTEARAARRRRNEAVARALPVKLSFPLVVCTLPSFMLLAIVPAVMAALTALGSDAW